MSKSMEDSLKKDLKDVLVSKSKKSTRELIEIAKSSENLNNLLGLFADHPEYKHLLFIHRLELFGYETQMPLEDMIKLPHLRLCNLFNHFNNKNKKLTEENLVNPKKDAVDYKDSLKQSLQIDNTNQEIITRNLIDVSTYFLVRILKKFPEINSLIIDTEQPNYGKIRDFIKKHENILDIIDDEIQKIFAEIQDDNNKEMDPVIWSKVRQLIDVSTKMLTRKNLEKYFEDMPKDYFIFAMFPMHLISINILGNLLKGSDLSYAKYLEILDHLYDLNLIIHRSTISLCQNCFLENSLVFQSFGYIKPTQIFSPECPNCHKTQLNFSMFSLEDNLKDIILSQDGFLSVYFGWLLQNKGIKFDCEYEMSQTQEIDFIIEKSVLVEVKMVHSGKSLPNVINEAVDQINIRTKVLNSNGINIRKSYILWNMYKDKIENCDIEIISPDKIEDLVMKIYSEKNKL